MNEYEGLKPVYPVPPRTATIGMLLFLLALSVLFAASIVGYVAMRIGGTGRPPPGSLHLPALLWISTLIMIASSLTMSRALRAIRLERRGAFRTSLHFTIALAITFIAIQTLALLEMLRTQSQTQPSAVGLYRMLCVVILLHGLHVIGGLAALATITLGAHRGRYDHENHAAVRSAVWYWHFLDAVWIVLFLTMWSLG